MPDTVPPDGIVPPFVRLHTVDGEPVGALRARMSGALNSRLSHAKLKDKDYAPFDVLSLRHADPSVVLAAADGDGYSPGSAVSRRFTDHLSSLTDVLQFDLFVRPPLDCTEQNAPYSSRGKAAVIIDLISRGDDVVNRLNHCVFGLQRSRTFATSSFPSPLRLAYVRFDSLFRVVACADCRPTEPVCAVQRVVRHHGSHSRVPRDRSHPPHHLRCAGAHRHGRYAVSLACVVRVAHVRNLLLSMS